VQTTSSAPIASKEGEKKRRREKATKTGTKKPGVFLPPRGELLFSPYPVGPNVLLP